MREKNKLLTRGGCLVREAPYLLLPFLVSPEDFLVDGSIYHPFQYVLGDPSPTHLFVVGVGRVNDSVAC